MIRKKSKGWTFIFSLLPGAGEMYIDVYKRQIVCRVRRAWIFQDVFRHIICGIPMAGMQDLRRIS